MKHSVLGPILLGAFALYSIAGVLVLDRFLSTALPEHQPDRFGRLSKRLPPIYGTTMLGVVGGWELLVGVILASLGQWSQAIGPGGVGLIMACIPVARWHMTRQVTKDEQRRDDAEVEALISLVKRRKGSECPSKPPTSPTNGD